ncbi:MAG: lipopolysaccharide biosynthesis protein [Deltaproteobacteria bacterium]|jgi:O-antigen/teichoic acid export membrane protein|nr:lipopolysaccharide biosynthesis protein [Deltaproteobacteria bacterium]
MANKIKESLHYYTLLPLIYQVFRFVTAILLARILDPKDFGIIGLASIIVFYSNNLTNFGFSTALINKDEINSSETNSIFTVNLIISIFLTAIVIIFAPVIADFFAVSELSLALIAMSSIFIFTSFALVALTLLKRDMKFKTISKIELSTGVFQSILTLLLAYCGLGFWSMIIGLIASNFMNAALSLFLANWRPQIKIRVDALKKMLNYASWTFYEAQLRLLENYLDRLIIGKVLGPVNLGYYEKASGFALMPVESLVHKITGVMFSAFSRVKSDHEELLNYLEKTVVLVSIICFPIFAGFGVIADFFVPLLLGEKWNPMIPPLFFLLLAYSFYAIVSSVGVFNIASGSYKKQISARMLCLFFLIVLLLIYSKYGVTMVAAIIMGYQFLFLCVSNYIVSQRMGINYFLMVVWITPSIILTLIMTLTIILLKHFMFASITIGNMIMLILCGVVVYISLFFLFDFRSTRFLRDTVSPIWIKFSKYL